MRELRSNPEFGLVVELVMMAAGDTVGECSVAGWAPGAQRASGDLGAVPTHGARDRGRGSAYESDNPATVWFVDPNVGGKRSLLIEGFGRHEGRGAVARVSQTIHCYHRTLAEHSIRRRSVISFGASFIFFSPDVVPSSSTYFSPSLFSL